MRAYSIDLRERVVKAVEEGVSTKETARRFSISWASAKRYVKRYRETRDLQPKAKPGRPTRLGEAELAVLKEQCQKHKDASLEEHCKLLEGATGLRVSISTMQRWLKQFDITRKKESQTEPTG